jgi:hypothetical protein
LPAPLASLTLIPAPFLGSAAAKALHQIFDFATANRSAL